MKKILSVCLICTLILSLTCCSYLPEYKELGEDPLKGNMIEVNGVVYRTLPYTDWRPTWTGTKKVARNKEYDRDSNIFMDPEDTGQIFVMQQYSDNKIHPNYRENYFYREDVTLPPYDRSGIDMLGIEKRGLFSKYYFIQNKELIDQIFMLKNMASGSGYGGGECIYYLKLMNSNFPGIGIDASVYQSDKSYWIVFNDDTFARISQELLEQIFGERLPMPSE